MAGSASVPNVFGALAGNISLALLDQNYAALVGYANDPTNRVSVAVDSGAANGYVLTPSPAIPNYSNPVIVWFVPAHSNTTTSTANISGKGALTIFKDSGAGPVALTGGEIIVANLVGLELDLALNSGAGGFHLLNGQVTAGKVLQPVIFETGAVATGSTPMSIVDTIPTNTQGDQYMSLAYTPQNAGSTLIIDVAFNGSVALASQSQYVVALYQDATANALAAVGQTIVANSGLQPVSFRHKMVAGTTSSTTFKVRAGPGAAGTLTFNGQAGGRIFGGVMPSSITITEVLP